MKIYRGGRKAKKWDTTDTKSLVKWAETWQPHKQIQVDGTIQKEGERHTDFGIEFEPEDISALHDAFQRYQKHRIEELEAREVELSESVKRLETAFRKIGSLLVVHRKKAPSPDALLESVKKIANHFRWKHMHRDPIELEWIDWKSL